MAGKRPQSNQHRINNSNNNSNVYDSPLRRHFISRKVQTGGGSRNKVKKN